MFNDELVVLLGRLLDTGSSRGCLTERRCDARSALLPVGHGARVVTVHDDVLALSAILAEPCVSRTSCWVKCRRTCAGLLCANLA